MELVFQRKIKCDVITDCNIYIVEANACMTRGMIARFGSISPVYTRYQGRKLHYLRIVICHENNYVPILTAEKCYHKIALMITNKA